IANWDNMRLMRFRGSELNAPLFEIDKLPTQAAKLAWAAKKQHGQFHRSRNLKTAPGDIKRPSTKRQLVWLNNSCAMSFFGDLQCSLQGISRIAFTARGDDTKPENKAGNVFRPVRRFNRSCFFN